MKKKQATLGHIVVYWVNGCDSVYIVHSIYYTVGSLTNAM